MINDLKDFEKFLKICRKQGVNEVTCFGHTVKFGDLPNKLQIDELDEIPTDELTPEQMMFYAVNGNGGNPL
jgi:hypothetical protein